MDGYLRLLLIIAVSGIVGGCAQSHGIENVRLCPALLVGEGPSRSTYGGLASTGRFPLGACVEVFLGAERLAHTDAGFDGSFAVLFLMRGDMGGRELELRVTDVRGDGTVERVPFSLDPRSATLISYPEGTVPLAAHEGGRLEFNGSLGPTERDFAPFDDVWLANWSQGTVSVVAPTPNVRSPFTASVAGLPGACASPIARHSDGMVGGCWWPMGGGGCSPRCTVEQYLAGTCPPLLDRCAGRTGRGCTPIDVDEDFVVVPPPARPDSIYVPPADTVPFDGGLDAPIPDVPPTPDVPIDTPADVPLPDAPPADVELM